MPPKKMGDLLAQCLTWRSRVLFVFAGSYYKPLISQYDYLTYHCNPSSSLPLPWGTEALHVYIFR